MSDDSSASTELVVSDVVCCFCGCGCDDLRVRLADNGIIGVERACELGSAGFLQTIDDDGPEAAIEGSPASYAEAIKRASAILRKATRPLIYGLTRSTAEAQQAAVELADRSGAVLDTPVSTEPATVLALQREGMLTCSLGEIRHRADCLIYWGCDPPTTHPRHFERYSLNASGEVGGRESRDAIAVHSEPNRTTTAADTFLQIDPGTDLELLWTLRARLRGIPVAEMEINTEASAVTASQVDDLLQRMKAARYGVVIFGSGLTAGPRGTRNCEALFALIRELQNWTRWSVSPLGPNGNLHSARSVTTAAAGYPYAIDFGSGWPRFGPQMFAADRLLSGRQVDAVILVGDVINSLTAEQLRMLATLPLIEFSTAPAVDGATVFFRTAPIGLAVKGTFDRLDGVPLPLRAIIRSRYQDEAALLRALVPEPHAAPQP